MIMTIALRELRSLFLSPLAWAILGVVQLILGYLFLSQVDFYLKFQSQIMALREPVGVTEIVAAGLFGNAGVVLLLVVPLVTMRLVSEERRNRTLALLYSAPVSMTEIVLGKYLGVLLFLFVILALVAAMPLSLLAGGTLDLGLLAAGLLGLALLLAAFTAIGVFMSTLTQYPTVAAISTFGVLLLSWVLDFSGQGDPSSALAYLSLLNHYERFLSGIFDSADAVFLTLITITFLVLSVRRLDADRMGG
jgi:ABC-2 type transport system permease protein